MTVPVSPADDMLVLQHGLTCPQRSLCVGAGKSLWRRGGRWSEVAGVCRACIENVWGVLEIWRIGYDANYFWLP